MVCYEVASATDPDKPLPVQFIANDLFNPAGPITGDPDGSSCNYPVG